jgi:hypothetical protein
MSPLRSQLIEPALQWQKRHGVAPSITSALSEYDAAMLVGCPEAEYSLFMQPRTAVSKGHDFEHKGKKYQVTANRPSGKPGCRVTRVSLKKRYDWDFLVWVHYSEDYEISEAWQWDVKSYKRVFADKKRPSPDHMRKGKRLR